MSKQIGSLVKSAAIAVLLTTARCAPPGGDTPMATRVIDSPTAKAAADKTLPVVTGSRAVEVQATLVGPPDVVESGVGPEILNGGPIPSMRVQRYLESIRDRLLAKWPYKKPSTAIRIEVLPTHGYYADSFADGVIRIPIGALQKSQSNSGVAFIMGHELSHLLLKHQITREKQLTYAENEAQNARRRHEIERLRLAKRRSNQTATGIAASKLETATADSAEELLIADLMSILFDAGWSRQQEQEADFLGIDLMSAAGYDPSVEDSVLATFQADEDRVAAEAPDVSAILSRAVDNPAESALNFSFKDTIFGGMYYINDKLKSLAVSHPKAQARRDAALNYIDKYYSTLAGSAATGGPKDPLAEIKKTSDFTSLVKAVDQANEALHRLQDHDADGAAADAKVAGSLNPRWWGPHYLLALALLETGDRKRAMLELQQSLALEGVPYPAFERAALEYVRGGDIQGALNVMNAAERHFGGPEVTWPDRIVLYRLADNQSAVNAILSACGKSDNSREIHMCSEAANRPLGLASAKP